MAPAGVHDAVFEEVSPEVAACVTQGPDFGVCGRVSQLDLRHTGNTLAAASGASTRELMQRMGHASMRAALIYQHATSERDREIASAMDRRIAKLARHIKDPQAGQA